MQITGHTTVKAAEHYDQRNVEQRREGIRRAMSKLSADAKSRDEQMREIIGKVTPRTWKTDWARLLALLDDKA